MNVLTPSLNKINSGTFPVQQSARSQQSYVQANRQASVFGPQTPASFSGGFEAARSLKNHVLFGATPKNPVQTIGDYQVHMGNLAPEVLEKVSRLEKILQDAERNEFGNPVPDENLLHEQGLELLGVGMAGQAFRIPQTDIVIKCPYRASGALKREAEIMTRLPGQEKSGKNLYAYVENPKTGRQFLLSRFITGRPLAENIEDPVNKPITGPQLRAILDNILALEQAGIEHNDLNRSNVFLQAAGCDFIDFGEATPARAVEGTLFDMPNFLAHSDLTVFETMTLSMYINSLIRNASDESENPKEFLMEYFKEKSRYLEKRVEWLKGELEKPNSPVIPNDKKILAQNVLKYERTLAQVLKNPTLDILGMELLKLQILYASHLKKRFQATFTNVSPQFLLMLLTAWEVESAQKLKAKSEECPGKGPLMQDYLDSQQQLAKHYLDSKPSRAVTAAIRELNLAFNNPPTDHMIEGGIRFFASLDKELWKKYFLPLESSLLGS